MVGSFKLLYHISHNGTGIFYLHGKKKMNSPRKNNIARETLGLEDEFPFGKAFFQVPC